MRTEEVILGTGVAVGEPRSAIERIEPTFLDGLDSLILFDPVLDFDAADGHAPAQTRHMILSPIMTAVTDRDSNTDVVRWR